MSNTFHHVRNGSTPCARPWACENRHARRITRRAERRAARAWLASGRTDSTLAPVLPGTQGHLTH